MHPTEPVYLSLFVNNSKFADVIFELGENRDRLWAHRIVLSSVPAFDALFSSPMSEGQQTATTNQPVVVRLESASADAFRAVLHWIYTHNTVSVITSENCVEVLHLATQYMLGPLVASCVAQMGELVTDTNCFAFLGACERYGDQVEEEVPTRANFEALKQAALTRIPSGVLQTPDEVLSSFRNSELLPEICSVLSRSSATMEVVSRFYQQVLEPRYLALADKSQKGKNESETKNDAETTLASFKQVAIAEAALDDGFRTTLATSLHATVAPRTDLNVLLDDQDDEQYALLQKGIERHSADDRYRVWDVSLRRSADAKLVAHIQCLAMDRNQSPFQIVQVELRNKANGHSVTEFALIGMEDTAFAGPGRQTSFERALGNVSEVVDGKQMMMPSKAHPDSIALEFVITPNPIFDLCCRVLLRDLLVSNVPLMSLPNWLRSLLPLLLCSSHLQVKSEVQVLQAVVSAIRGGMHHSLIGAVRMQYIPSATILELGTQAGFGVEQWITVCDTLRVPRLQHRPPRRCLAVTSINASTYQQLVSHLPLEVVRALAQTKSCELEHITKAECV